MKNPMRTGRSTSTRSPDLKRFYAGLAVFAISSAALAGYYYLVCEIRGNFRVVVPRKVYRSAQPSPSQLKSWAQRYRLKTILCLRGSAGGITQQEKALAESLGLTMLSVPIRSYTPVPRDSLARLIRALEHAELPVLIHCRDGFDRGGMVSALAAMAIGNAPYEQAKWQAYVPPGPWKRRRKRAYVHISDVLRDYERYRRANPPAAGDWEHFKHWAAAEAAAPPTSSTPNLAARRITLDKHPPLRTSNR